MSKFPELTQQPIHSVNATPDNEYPIRILEAYRENCNSKWSTDTAGNCDNPLFTLMNEHADQRALILDKAIEILRRNLN